MERVLRVFLRGDTGEIQARDLIRHLVLRSLDFRFGGLDGGTCCLEAADRGEVKYALRGV